MSREILIATPENIEIEYELAGVGSRLLANLLDSVFQLLILLGVGVIGFIVGLLLYWSGSAVAKAIGEFLAGVATAAVLIVVFLVMWGYFIYFETKWNGQTPGKRQFGLRVIRDGGSPTTPFATITRNLLRVLDGMPLIIVGLMLAGAAQGSAAMTAMGALPILLSLVFMLGSARYQRLGDFVAGTMVVKQRAPRVPTLEALAPPPRVLPEHLAGYALADIGRHVYEMTIPEYRAVRHSIDRRWELAPNIQQTAAMRLAVPLMARLGISAPPGTLYLNYADFLEYLAVAFEQYRGVK